MQGGGGAGLRGGGRGSGVATHGGDLGTGTAADRGSPPPERPLPVETARSGPQSAGEGGAQSGCQSGLGDPFQLLVLLQFPHPAETRGRSQETSGGGGGPRGGWRQRVHIPRGPLQRREHLCRQRRRNLMIFRAAWSCFLVRKEPLVAEERMRRRGTPAPSPSAP